MADQADANIFGSQTTGDNKGGGGNTPNSQNDDLATLLGEIKNERGEPKYKNVQEALKALNHAQQYIPTLKSKEQELEQKLNDALAKLTKMETLEASVLELTRSKEQPGNNQPTGLNEEQVAELVTRTLTKTQQEAIQKQNLDGVVNATREKFGDKAAEVFYGKAKELGMTVEEFNTLAARTPKAVLKLIGVEGSTTVSRTPVQFNTDGFQPSQDSKVGRNEKSALIGATTEEIHAESANAKQMAEELRANGGSVYDLTDPKVYFKHFGKR